MRVWGVGFLVMCLALACGSVARAAEVDDYIYWRTAKLVDVNCHYLKAVERRVLDTVIHDALRAIPQYQLYMDDRMPADDYTIWISTVHDRAETTANSLGCTAAAEPYLLAARGAASQAIYQDLVIAFHYNGLPADDQQRLPVPTDQIQAANGYLLFLEQVYGANFAAFQAAQREAAALRLPQVSGFSDTYNPFGFDAPSDAEGDVRALWELQTASHKTLMEVHFEVSAEVAGYRVWPEARGTAELPALHPDSSTESSGLVVAGPTAFPIGEEDKLNGVLVRMLDGGLWLMSYGDTAKAIATKPSKLALLVRTSPLPEGQSAGGAWSQENWRELATSFELTPVSAACLGGPCWKVPEEGKAAILANSPIEYSELWISTDPAAAPDAASYVFRRGGIYAGPIFSAEGLQPY